MVFASLILDSFGVQVGTTRKGVEGITNCSSRHSNNKTTSKQKHQLISLLSSNQSINKTNMMPTPVSPSANSTSPRPKRRNRMVSLRVGSSFFNSDESLSDTSSHASTSSRRRFRRQRSVTMVPGSVEHTTFFGINEECSGSGNCQRVNNITRLDSTSSAGSVFHTTKPVMSTQVCLDK